MKVAYAIMSKRCYTTCFFDYTKEGPTPSTVPKVGSSFCKGDCEHFEGVDEELRIVECAGTPVQGPIR